MGHERMLHMCVKDKEDICSPIGRISPAYYASGGLTLGR